MGGLVAECSFVEEVTKDSQGEDGHCKTIAGIERVSASHLGEDLVVVF